MAVMQQEEQYESTVMQAGNSRGMRLPAGFFCTHLKFEDEGMVTVVADGANLVSAKSVAKQKSKDIVDVVELDGLFCATLRKVRTRALACHLACDVVIGVGTRLLCCQDWPSLSMRGISGTPRSTVLSKSM